MGFWNLLASLIYAFIDFIVFELATLAIFKINDKNSIKIGSRKGKFKPSEYFVFGMIGLAISYFYISNLFQDLVIEKLVLLKWWLFLILSGLFSLSMLILSKFVLNRRWDFRMVIISLILLGTVVIISVLGVLIRLKIIQ